MKNKELIEKLSKLDPELDVFFWKIENILPSQLYSIIEEQNPDSEYYNSIIIHLKN